jgi:HTH-type transcriptional regulator/antitoxin HigA
MTKVIKTDEQYNSALAEVEGLLDSDPQAETEEADKLELLALLISEYERKHFPVELPDPIEAVKFRMEQQQLSQKDLIPYIGSRSKVSEVLNRKRPLTLKMIRSLHQGLGIPLDVLILEIRPESSNNSVSNWRKISPAPLFSS